MFGDMNLLELKNLYDSVKTNNFNAEQLKKFIGYKLIKLIEVVDKREEYLNYKLNNLIKKSFFNNFRISRFINNYFNINSYYDYETFLRYIEKINDFIYDDLQRNKKITLLICSNYELVYENKNFKKHYLKKKESSKCNEKYKQYKKYEKLITKNNFEKVKELYKISKELKLVKDLKAQFVYKESSVEIVDKLDVFVNKNKKNIAEVSNTNKKSKTFWQHITNALRGIKNKFKSLFFKTPKKPKQTLNNLVNVVGRSL